MSNDPLHQVGLVRTDMHCHACSGDFIAVLNYDMNGKQEVECPRCGHIHYRDIKDGRVTEERYGSDSRTRQVSDDQNRVVWKAQTTPIATMTTASIFMRDLWLKRES